MKKTLIFFMFLAVSFSLAGQRFTYQDTLRGSITPEREWWDLVYYHLEVKVDPGTKSLTGRNTVQYRVLQSHNILQIDLQKPLKIKSVHQNGSSLKFENTGAAYFIHLDTEQPVGSLQNLVIEYGGNPREAKRPPWDGGVTWKKDTNGKDFVATSCQGIGASIWWPCKDHMYDEPDSMLISINVPSDLMDVSNGRLRHREELRDGTTTYHWFVGSPINNYGVNFNIGDYVHFHEVYQGEAGPLDVDIYVLKENEDQMDRQRTETRRMLRALEHWFGPYPFYKDGYKLVEAPYLGMEHQSSITYGNGYQNGYLGRDLSGTGWGLKFDFIIVHESGHEWFANNITYKDVADMWVHEGFTNYSENLFLDYHYGKVASSDYVIGTRKVIQNDRPIIGPYGVNKRGSGDMYYKGGNLLHTLRQVVDNDEKWRMILRGLNDAFYHQTVTTHQIENYMSRHIGKDLNPFFNQYLRDTRIPILEYQISQGVVKTRWTHCVPGFDLPLKVKINDQTTIWIHPNEEWSEVRWPGVEKLEVDRNFYVKSKMVE